MYVFLTPSPLPGVPLVRFHVCPLTQNRNISKRLIDRFGIQMFETIDVYSEVYSYGSYHSKFEVSLDCFIYSRGSNSEHSNSESIRKPNFLKVCFRMVDHLKTDHSKTKHSKLGHFSMYSGDLKSDHLKSGNI